MDAAALIETADRNYRAAFELVAQHWAWDVPGRTREFGRAVAIVTGHPSSGFYNPVLVTAEGTSSDDVLAAVAWVRGLGLPASVHVRDGAGGDELPIGLARVGLEPDPWRTPVMAMDPIPDPPPPTGDVRIVAADGGSFDTWRRAFAESEDAVARVKRTFGPSMVDDPRVRFLSGSVDSRVIATAIAIRSDTTVGIYAVGTDAAYRKRGIGTAMTWAAIRAGIVWGCSTAILQSSEMGLRVYAAMGFRAVTAYQLYEPGDAGS